MSYPTTQDELRPLAHRELCKAIESFGLQTEAQDVVIRVVGTPFQILCHEVKVSREGEAVSLTVRLALGMTPEDPVIEDSLSGSGESFEAALKGAVKMWLATIFVSVLALLDADSRSARRTSSERREYTSAAGQKSVWRLISSPLITHGENKIQAQADLQPPDVRPFLEPLFAELARDEKPHWIKVFMTFTPDGKIGGGCIVDNYISERGSQLLLNSGLICKASILRQFFILWPDFEATPAPQEEPTAKKGFFSRFKSR